MQDILVSGQIVPGRCHQRAQHYLTQLCSCAFPAVCFTGIITPLCTIVRTLSSPKGTFYSPAFVSDILTRSHETCHRREREETNARIPESTHKEKQTTPEAILITHNHVNAASPHTHACTRSRAHPERSHTHTHTLPERAAGVQSRQEPAEN